MQTELFATKGVEYLLVITYLVILVTGFRFIFPRRQTEQDNGQYRLPDDLLYHQGHTWAKPEGEHFVRVGMDDLAQSLLGDDARLILPLVGAHVEEGLPAWHVQARGHALPMLSPVDGDVVAVNHHVVDDPHLVHEDPYERGWLLEVRVPHPTAVHRNLLSGELAHAWLEESEERINDADDWEDATLDVLRVKELAGV